MTAELAECVSWLESELGRRFEDPTDPLLVSVRSGAPVSMPGMMDTILNLGLNDETTAGLASVTSAPFAWGLYRRLLHTFATVVRGLDADDVRKRLATDEDVALISGQAQEAADKGISGVPTFVFAQKYAVSGAQPADQLARAIRQVSAEINAQAAE